MNDIWKTLKSAAYDSKGFSKDEKFARVSKSRGEKGNMFNPPVGEDDAEEVSEVVPGNLLEF